MLWRFATSSRPPPRQTFTLLGFSINNNVKSATTSRDSRNYLDCITDLLPGRLALFSMPFRLEFMPRPSFCHGTIRISKRRQPPASRGGQQTRFASLIWSRYRGLLRGRADGVMIPSLFQSCIVVRNECKKCPNRTDFLNTAFLRELAIRMTPVPVAPFFFCKLAAGAIFLSRHVHFSNFSWIFVAAGQWFCSRLERARWPGGPTIDGRCQGLLTTGLVMDAGEEDEYADAASVSR
ncbi:hypothetical protein R3P38DRAFT_2834887 [Favolaschia claudopus]|uniref:Uncharacterized protein n=1 Tax=Favolaschia claudopus TaxID=2862362 RepID=A0AAW0EB88_9AGAR